MPSATLLRDTDRTLTQTGWDPGSPILFFFFLMFIYLFWGREREREREREQRRAEREGDRIPRRLSVEPDVGLESMNHEIMTWAETKNWMLNQFSHPGAPNYTVLTKDRSVDFNNTIDQVDRTDMYRTFYSTTVEYISSQVHVEHYIRIGHMWGNKRSLSKFKNF